MATGIGDRHVVDGPPNRRARVVLDQLERPVAVSPATAWHCAGATTVLKLTGGIRIVGTDVIAKRHGDRKDGGRAGDDRRYSIMKV